MVVAAVVWKEPAWCHLHALSSADSARVAPIEIGLAPLPQTSYPTVLWICSMVHQDTNDLYRTRTTQVELRVCSMEPEASIWAQVDESCQGRHGRCQTGHATTMQLCLHCRVTELDLLASHSPLHLLYRRRM